MPTVFTHVAVPLCAAIALGTRRLPASAVLAGMLASIVPDFDGLAFKFGIAYGGMAGHRGFTHTLVFALLLGLAGWWLAPRWRMRPAAGWAWIALCAASHPLLDMLTNGGSGVALWWPFSSERVFFSWRPVLVAPISVARFFSARGWQVLLSEGRWILLPCLALAAAIRLGRRGRATT